MQTVDLKLDVPVGYSLEEFVAQIKDYAARLAKKYQTRADDYVYEPNEETKDAIREAKAHMSAIKCGKVNANEGAIDTSSVEAMLKSCGL